MRNLTCRMDLLCHVVWIQMVGHSTSSWPPWVQQTTANISHQIGRTFTLAVGGRAGRVELDWTDTVVKLVGSDGVSNSIDSCLETLEVWRLNNSISSYLIIYLKSLTLPKALTRAWRNRRLSFVDFVLPWGVWSVYWRAGFVNHSERERETRHHVLAANLPTGDSPGSEQSQQSQIIFQLFDNSNIRFNYWEVGASTLTSR